VTAPLQQSTDTRENEKVTEPQEGVMDQEGMSRLMAAKLRARKKQDKDNQPGE
jgi:hypothetical protein